MPIQMLNSHSITQFRINQAPSPLQSLSKNQNLTLSSKPNQHDTPLHQKLLTQISGDNISLQPQTQMHCNLQTHPRKP